MAIQSYNNLYLPNLSENLGIMFEHAVNIGINPTIFWNTFVNSNVANTYFKKSEITNLKKIRQARGLSQSKLAELAEVELRSIQMYEQRRNDINKAQVETIYKLSRVLGCNIEDLLEN